MTKTYAKIELTQGYITIVDKSDLDRLSMKSWYAVKAQRNTYARNDSLGRMHRYLLAAPTGIAVDHKNGDGLDNRRCNLRLATYQQNSFNKKRVSSKTSCPYKGVMRSDKPYQPWEVRISIGGKRHRFGRYKTAIEAALAYDQIVIELHREFAYLNFPERYAIKQRNK